MVSPLRRHRSSCGPAALGALLHLLLLILAAPGSAGATPLDADPEERTVFVTNRSAGNLTVSVVFDGTEYVLGRVSSLQTRRFDLPKGRASARAQLMATGIGNRSQPIVSSTFHTGMGPFLWEITEGSLRAATRPADPRTTRTHGMGVPLYEELM